MRNKFLILIFIIVNVRVGAGKKPKKLISDSSESKKVFSENQEQEREEENDQTNQSQPSVDQGISMHFQHALTPVSEKEDKKIIPIKKISSQENLKKYEEGLCSKPSRVTSPSSGGIRLDITPISDSQEIHTLEKQIDQSRTHTLTDEHLERSQFQSSKNSQMDKENVSQKSHLSEEHLSAEHSPSLSEGEEAPDMDFFVKSADQKISPDKIMGGIEAPLSALEETLEQKNNKPRSFHDAIFDDQDNSFETPSQDPGKGQLSIDLPINKEVSTDKNITSNPAMDLEEIFDARPIGRRFLTKSIDSFSMEDNLVGDALQTSLENALQQGLPDTWREGLFHLSDSLDPLMQKESCGKKWSFWAGPFGATGRLSSNQFDPTTQSTHKTRVASQQWGMLFGLTGKIKNWMQVSLFGGYSQHKDTLKWDGNTPFGNNGSKVTKSGHLGMHVSLGQKEHSWLFKNTAMLSFGRQHQKYKYALSGSPLIELDFGFKPRTFGVLYDGALSYTFRPSGSLFLRPFVGFGVSYGVEKAHQASVLLPNETLQILKGRKKHTVMRFETGLEIEKQWKKIHLSFKLGVGGKKSSKNTLNQTVTLTRTPLSGTPTQTELNVHTKNPKSFYGMIGAEIKAQVARGTYLKGQFSARLGKQERGYGVMLELSKTF